MDWLAARSKNMILRKKTCKEDLFTQDISNHQRIPFNRLEPVPPPTMIKVISFDFDGTLATHSFADAFWLEGVPALYAKQNNITLEAAKKYILKEYDNIGDNRVEW